LFLKKRKTDFSPLKKEAMKPQNVEQFIYNQPVDRQNLFILLREIVLGTDPEIVESLGWGIPKYTLHSMLGYLSFDQKTGEVYIGLNAGLKLNDPGGILELGNRTMICIVRFKDEAELLFKAEALGDLLQQAVDLQKEKKQKKR
jgi:hypothetical protein